MTFTERTDILTTLHRVIFWKLGIADSLGYVRRRLKACAVITRLQQYGPFPNDVAHCLDLQGGHHSSHLLSRHRRGIGNHPKNLLFLSVPAPNELCQCGGSPSEEKKKNHLGKHRYIDQVLLREPAVRAG